MSLSKQAKILSKGQVEAVLAHAFRTRNPKRNRAIALLSIRGGLRAKEIAHLTWAMVVGPDGSVGHSIHLLDSASKGSSGRVIPLSRDLQKALDDLYAEQGHPDPDSRVVRSERSRTVSAQSIVNLFFVWYEQLGFTGCSSHSGRRTFITNAARKISTVGGSLRDVQVLAGHSRLSTTQRYIEADSEAQRRVVNLV